MDATFEGALHLLWETVQIFIYLHFLPSLKQGCWIYYYIQRGIYIQTFNSTQKVQLILCGEAKMNTVRP